MLYDKYVKKAKKIVSFKNFLIRFRVLIITVTASILTLSTSYMSTKGLVFDKTSCPLNIEYGENINYQANALFEDVTYEYSLSNENNWSSVMPKYPGEYKVRGVSKKLFGGTSYGKVHTFEIKPKLIDVSIIDDSLIYGQTPLLNANLLNGDSISYTDFTYYDLEGDSPSIEAIADSIIVKDINGNDVTFCYSFNPIKKNVDLLPNDITITVHGAEKVYDGTSLICHQYELTSGRLFKNDQIYATFEKSQLEIGNTKNDATINIINEEGINISKYYNISYEVGKLEITARPLLVHTPSSTQVYNGLSLENKDYTIDESTSLVDGHTSSVLTFTSITNVCKQDNILSIDIYDENNNKVTDNYAITYVVGELEVTSRPLKITTGSNSKTYDGKELTCLDYTIDSTTSLVDNHNISISNNSTLTNAGTIDNELEFKIMDNETDVTSNYNIEVINGSLTVDKKDVTITSASDSKVYDGQELFNNTYDVTAGEIIQGHNIKATFNASISNVGNTDNVFEVVIFGENSDDVTSNYNITLLNGTLNITQREIDILTGSSNKEYDGKKLIDTEFEITSNIKLAKDQVIEVVSNSEIINVGEIENKLEFKVLSNEEDVTNNYKINISFGNLVVTKRNITIESASDSRQYDANEFYVHDYKIVEGSLAENQLLENTYYNSIIYLGTINNAFDSVIKDENNVDVTANYKIIKVEGILEITKREISILTSNDEKVYDGKPLICEDYEITSDNKLAGTDILNITSNTSITNVGSVDNVLEFKVTSFDDEDLSNNYQITVNNGILKVTKRKICILTNSESKTYDDTELFNDGYTITDGYLADNQILEVVEYTKVIDVAKDNYENVLKFKLFDNGVDVTDNYSLDVTYGTLTINPIVLDFTTGSSEKIYDGKEFSNSDISFVGGELLSNHEIEYSTYVLVKDAGEYDNDVCYVIKDKITGADKTHNYKINLKEGKLIIFAREITISTPSLEKVYDGKEMSANTYQMSGTLAENQSITVVVNNSIKDAGELNNVFNVNIIDENGIDVTHNYKINKEIGLLKITLRPITITTPSLEKVYDGKEMSANTYQMSGTLAENQSLFVSMNNSITDVGTLNNTFTFKIKDENDNDVTHNYALTERIGELTIQPRPITVMTYSAQKVYDGIVLNDERYQISSGTLADQQIAEIFTTGSIKDVGTTPNDFEITIKDVNGKDVTFNYEINKDLGVLTILPVKLTINTESAEKIYDGLSLENNKFEITEGQLVASHILNVEFMYSIVNVCEVNNDIIINIINQDNEDVTHNYEITKELGTLKITPRQITVKTQSDSKVYDGIVLTKDGYEITGGSLAPNQKEIVVVTGAITNVGNCLNDISINIVDVNGNDTTSNYEITKDLGNLEITPRPITIKTHGAEKVYDGIVLTKDGYEITGGSLAPNQKEYINVIGSIVNVGEKYNEISVVILDVYGNDTTSNYEITQDLGLLKITPRPLTIKTQGAEKVYDGIVLTKDGYEITEGTLAPNQTYQITMDCSLVDVGEINNDFVIVIKDANGDETTSNYEITRDLGLLKITPRPLTIKTQGAEKVYDGIVLTKDGYEITKGTVADNQTAYIYVIGSIINVGKTDNEISIIILDAAENDVTYNYEITEDLGVLKITPRPITIKTQGAEKVYDGIELTKDGYEITEGTLAPNQKETVVVIGTITNVGNVLNDFEIVIENVLGEITTSNYKITRDLGVLRITPRPITVKTYSAEKVYDDTPLTKDGYEITEGTLAPNQKETVVVKGTITNVGKVSNNFEIVIKDALGNETTSNYDIKKDLGTLTITPIILHYATGSAEKVYDGTPLTNSELTHIKGNVLSHHVLDIFANGSITKVGQVKNTVFFEVYDYYTWEDKTENYLLVLDSGTLKVTPIILKYETGSAEKVYDGTPLTNSELIHIEGEVLNGQEITIYTIGSIIDVGEVKNNVYYSIYDTINDEDVTDCYQIDVIYGTLKVTPIVLKYKTGSGSKIYDGTALTNPKVSFISGRALNGHKVEIEAISSLIEVGKISNEAEYKVTDALGNDVTHNYQFEIEKGSLEVKPIVLNYQTGSASKEYDGTPITNSEVTLISGKLLNGHSINIYTTGSQLKVGKSENSIEYVVFDENNNDITNCYEIKCDYGVLEIIGIEITVKTGSETKEYDGTALTCDKIIYNYEDLKEGHTLYYEITGSQTKVGSSDNTVKVIIYDSEGEEVTDIYYNIVIQAGTLKVTSSAGESGSGGGSGGGFGGLDTSGNLSGAGNGSDDKEVQEAPTVFYITTDIDGTIYLRLNSFGDYKYSGWDDIPPSFNSKDALTNPNYLTARALQANGYQPNTITVEYAQEGVTYLLPYYATNAPENISNDYFINPQHKDTYTLDYIYYQYSSLDNYSVKGTIYEDLEAEYYEFVKKNYMALPDSTRVGMQKIIDDNGIDINSPTLIEDVAKYIQNAAEYNLKFAPYPYGVDYALYFLNDAKEGICQHYATAATVMYRTLGIPARYVGGFVGYASANEKSKVTTNTYHAWVEVYIQGLGWVPVEVTGGGAAVEGEDYDENESMGTKTITVKPIDVNKEYDGTPLYPENDIDFESDKVLFDLFQKGYTWDVVVSGSQTEIGTSSSEVVSFKLYDSSHNDVTSQFKVKYKTGELKVTGPQIEIFIFSYVKDYDGIPLSYTNEDCFIFAPDGLTVEYELNGTITEPGTVQGEISNVIVKDVNGNDVTDLYYIDIVKGSLTIDKVNIEVTANSIEKKYDGTPLTSEECWVSFGALIEGHSLVTEVIGKIVDIGTEKNKISSVKVVDENGNDVTKYYEIKKVDGVLTII